MAIYHLSAKIVKRGEGRSVVAAAAYRAGERLEEEATGIVFDYTRKAGIEHREILAPQGAPEWVFDRSRLWNAVEATEKRRDAQLAREIEVGLPVELRDAEQVALLRDFVRREFVSKGMVADLSIHRDHEHNPHAHVLLTMRSLGPGGFGPKERAWNERSQLLTWRAAWEEVTNAHLARADLAVRIDHRSLKAQGLELTPGRKIGVGLERQASGELPPRIAERVAEQKRIAHENGERILADPTVALKALTYAQATFTEHDVAKYLHTRTEGAEQFRAAFLKVTTSPELVRLGRDERARARYTSREMLDIERTLLQRAERMAQRRGHDTEEAERSAVRSQHALSGEQHAAFQALTAAGDLKALVGVAGSGKSHLLAAAREAWEAQGYTVKGAALSGIAAENLELASGIRARTIASWEHAWAGARDPLSAGDVLVIDEAGLVGTRQLARVLEAAERARAKVVLVGDPEQLQAIEAGAAFRGILAESGVAELRQVHRQAEEWQRQATRQLSSGATREALGAYERHGAIVPLATREAARAALLARWAHDAEQDRARSRLMLAYTRQDVQVLNEQARALRAQRGELGRTERIDTERGPKDFAVHDRLYFLRNEKSLGVKNGSLGSIEAVEGGVLQVRLDGDERRVAIDTRFYRDLDYGYAATVYKAQGATVDRSYVLATSHFDRHSAYVALSRHREAAAVFYAAEDFAGWEAREVPTAAEARERFLGTLSRARPKDLAHDYLEREPQGPVDSGHSMPLSASELEERQRQAAERWRGHFFARASAGEENAFGISKGQALDLPHGGRRTPHHHTHSASLDPDIES